MSQGPTDTKAYQYVHLVTHAHTHMHTHVHTNTHKNAHTHMQVYTLAHTRTLGHMCRHDYFTRQFVGLVLSRTGLLHW